MYWGERKHRTLNCDTLTTMTDRTRTEEPVHGVEGSECAERETTAAGAQAMAPNPAVAHEVRGNVIQAREAAEKAAQAAQGMGPEVTGDPVSGVDVLQREVEHKTNAAVAQGRQDIGTAKNVGSQYADQAKTTASNIVDSAKNALHGTSEEKPRSMGSSTGISAPGPTSPSWGTGDALTSLQEKASSAVGASQQYLASAQATVQPHIDRVREVAQTYLGVGTESITSGVAAPPVETSERPRTNLRSDTAQGVPGAFPGDSGLPVTTTNVNESKP